jgi:hypothetical protein
MVNLICVRIRQPERAIEATPVINAQLKLSITILTDKQQHVQLNNQSVFKRFRSKKKEIDRLKSLSTSSMIMSYR